MNPYCIYFPQFYPTPTNDAAWGKGFTDWSLVANANMHNRWERRAPRRGFYDGKNPAVHHEQLQEMMGAGLGGAAVYHYWFYTHQELPAFEKTLAEGVSPLPWFLIWASEGWSRRWLGDPSSVVELTRDPSTEEVQRHCDYLAGCFANPSYSKWGNRPLFAIYNISHFSSPQRVVDLYRSGLAQRGFNVALGHFVKNPSDAAFGKLFDINYLFEPRLFFGTQKLGRGDKSRHALEAVKRLAGESFTARLLVGLDRFQAKGRKFTAESFLDYMSSLERRVYKESIPGIVREVLSPGWNNTPRYEARFTCLNPLPPTEFGKLVRKVAQADADVPSLINAWNEWSEGAAIEPCAYRGTSYLDVLAESIESVAVDIRG